MRHRSKGHAPPRSRGIGKNDRDVGQDCGSQDEQPTYHRPVEHREGENREQEGGGTETHGQQVTPDPSPLVLIEGGREAGDGEYLLVAAGSAFPHMTTISGGACDAIPNNPLASSSGRRESAAPVH